MKIYTEDIIKKWVVLFLTSSESHSKKSYIKWSKVNNAPSETTLRTYFKSWKNMLLQCGVPLKEIGVLPCRSGSKNSNWRGGLINTPYGYIRIFKPEHPLCDHDGYVYLHRLIVEEEIGRYLTSEEQIHHKDLNTKNNSIENLEIVDKISHWILHRKINRNNQARLSCLLLNNGRLK